MRQRELLEFRTPQHPIFGDQQLGRCFSIASQKSYPMSPSNKGMKGSTPSELATKSSLLMRKIPFSFLKLKPRSTSVPQRQAGEGFLAKLIMFSPRKEKSALGSGTKKKKRWLPRWNPENRWPQGWC
ncbi:hypothetical protein Acr_13g0009780 [Actinidia rufa]|uniref:Uncharacterized protein n=1 Tax=Actinidia rufa TaxID=165716 RepID=A0A7J0FLI2_9ERIC|nr:hypothetical protein Acr_13g0009780 [Actinidia rufa]